MHTTLERLSHQKETYLWLYLSGSVLFLLSIVLWWSVVSVQPERVFWGTVDNNLASNGTTLTIISSNQQMQDEQRIQFSLGKTNTVHAVRTVKQNGTTVDTESVGDTKQSFTRYTNISTAQKNKDNKTPDLKSILGVWAQSSEADQSPLLQQVGLGTALPLGAMPIPFGSMQSEDRLNIIRDMRTKSLYQTDFSKTKKEHKDGKLLYTYEVKMQPVMYLSIMKSFAKHVGLHDLDNLDPQRYREMQTIAVNITIDAHAKQMVRVTAADKSYTETFSGNGVAPDVKLPDKAISAKELQARLSTIE